VDIDLHRLELRYERLRKQSPDRERHLLASLAEIGQQTPILVIAGGEEGRLVVIDGYKRVRVLRRLCIDTARAALWELSELEALLLERFMRTAESDGPLEQGWLLCELQARFGMTPGELARRFDKTASWVSRRLSLVRELPEAIQEHVRRGAICAHAAMKYLVPLVRANASDCARLADAVAPLRLSTRDVGALYGGWLTGHPKTRALVLGDPALYLRAREAEQAAAAAESPLAQLLDDLGALGGVARRAKRRLSQELMSSLLPHEREEIVDRFGQASADVQAIGERLQREKRKDAGPEHADCDPQVA
jgi:ParB family transcriptional regulator, chromosome partitioning protein